MACNLISQEFPRIPLDGGGFASVENPMFPPLAASDLNVFLGSAFGLLTWGATSYTTSVYRRDVTAAGNFELVIANIVNTENTYYDTGVIPENQYEWYITRTNAFGTSPSSNVVGGTTLPEAATGGVEGGTAAFGWNAPDGIVDGNDLIISSDTYTFTPPSKLIWMGFGAGWLYEQPDDTEFLGHSVVTVSGTETFTAETTPGENLRLIKTVEGRKYLYTDFVSTEHPSRVGAGMINWDTGADMVPGDRPYMFRVSRMSVETGPTTFQWKGERIGAYENLPDGTASNPSVYLKSFSGGPTVTTYNSAGGASEFYFDEGLNKFGEYSMTGFQWRQNTPGQTDGAVITHGSRISSGVNYIRQIPTRSDSSLPNGLITDANTNRPRWMKVQDYVGNIVSSSNIELWTTDFFWQLNGTMFVIADNPVLDDAQIWTPLVPKIIHSSDTWTMRLWKGMLSDYDSAYLFLLDQDLNVITSTSLQGTVAADAVLTITGTDFGAGPQILHFDRFEGEHLELLSGTRQADVGQYASGVPLDAGAQPRLYFDEDTNRTWFSHRDAAQIGSSDRHAAAMMIDFGQVVSTFRLGLRAYVPIGKKFPGAATPGTYPSFSSWKFTWAGELDGNGTDLAGTNTPFSNVCFPTHTGNGSISIAGNNNSPTYFDSYARLFYQGFSFTAPTFYTFFQSGPGTAGVYDQVGDSIFANDEEIVRQVETNVDPFSGDVMNFRGYNCIRLGGWFGNGESWEDTVPLLNDIYVAIGDNARACILVSDSPVFATSTQVFMPPPDNWTSPEITCTIKPHEDLGYVHIIKADGTLLENVSYTRN